MACQASEWVKDSNGLYTRREGFKVQRFGEKFIVQTKGRWVGQPLLWEHWQRQFLNELFLRRPDGSRVYDRALLGIGRKNGKSTLSAALALYGLIGMGEASPEVYACAAAKDQAGIVFRQASEFVQASPALMDWLKPQRGIITCESNKGIFKVLSADGGLQMGLNPNEVVIDELHEHKNRSLWDAMTTADLARENPLVIAITTAGFDRDSVCYEQYEYGLELRRTGGLEAMRKEGFLFWWYEVPALDDKEQPIDYRDQSYWQMANPSSWIENERLERYQRRMPENVFRRLHLNQWTESEDAWIKPWAWDACKGTPMWDPKAPTWIAVDVGGRKDSSAIVWVQWHGNKLHVGQELLIPTDERRYSLEDTHNTVLKWANVHSKLREIDYDPWQFQVSGEQMANRGLPMVEFPQQDVRMGPASETLSDLIGERRLVHDGNPDLRKHVLAAVAVATERGGWKVSKKKSLERIDGCIALVMAADRAVTMRNERPKGTVHIY